MTPIDPATVQTLLSLSKSQNLVQRALELCNVALDNCAADDVASGEAPLGGFERGDILLKPEKQALVFSNERLKDPYIETWVGLYVVIEDPDTSPPQPTEIGTYRLITSTLGEAVDDYLVLTETKGND